MDSIWGSTAQYMEITWGWQIAVYLFIAGLSAGAVISALLIGWSSKQDQSPDGLVQAGAIIGPVAIGIGQGLLVLDLGKPLSFYLLMLHFQLHSVMSIGVVLLMGYTGLSVLYAVLIFREPLTQHRFTGWLFLPLAGLLDKVVLWRRWLGVALCLAAVGIAVYTGFLLSVLVAKPLLNSALLPLLFLISGMSAGVAANILLGVTVFGVAVQQKNLQTLLSLDMKLFPAELFVLFLLFTGLFNMGSVHALAAWQALTGGPWALVFWLGVVGVGLILPAIVAAVFLHKNEAAGETDKDKLSVPILLVNSTLVLTGVILLRFYVLFAGQIYMGN
jgi:polysulfide reductase chain C